jgi:Flp pilus assembly protein TadG
MKAMIRTWMWPFGSSLNHFFRNRQGVAATEFAMIAPFMLIAFFGTVEFCTAVAIDRKITLVARTLADLTAQQSPPTISTDSATIADIDLQNNFTAGSKIVQSSYDATPLQSTISEVYVDNTGRAIILWSKSAIIQSGANTATLTTSQRNQGDDVSAIVPAELLTHKTYLIFSEVSYNYIPTIGYVMAKTGVNMSDVSYTRPRQATCIVYSGTNEPKLNGTTCQQPLSGAPL